MTSCRRWQRRPRAATSFMRRHAHVIIESRRPRRLATFDAGGPAVQSRRAFRVRGFVNYLQRPFRRLLLAALPDLAPSRGLGAVDFHGELEAIPFARLPRKRDTLFDARHHFP